MTIPEPNTAEWLTWRKTKIGASDIPVIMGLSPYCTPLQLWKEKLGFAQRPDSWAMQFGRENESKVRNIVMQRTNLTFHPKTCVHEEFPWHIATLDGWNDKEEVVLEIKCANIEDHKLALAGQIPEKYYPQVQWQMHVTGTNKAIYASFNKDDTALVFVESNERDIERYIQAANHFHDCLVNWDPPEFSEKDYVRIEDPDFQSVAHSYAIAKMNLDEAKKQEKFWKDKVLDFTDDGNCEGYGLRITRCSRKGDLDITKLIADFDISTDDLEKYRKDQIGYWKISIVKDEM